MDNVNEFDIKKIKKGILSIHAKWSGYSLMNGKYILKLIDDSESDDFEINIIDIDLLNIEKQTELFGRVCHGYFESFWIEEGEIKFMYIGNNNKSEMPTFENFLNNKIKITNHKL